MLHKYKYYLLVLLISFILVLLILLMAQRWDEFRLMYYVNTALRPRELPTRLIRPAFRLVTKRELPQKADGLHGLFHGGRDPGIFIRFETDSEGIAYITETFAKPGVIFRTLDVNSMRMLNELGNKIFVIPFLWQEKSGVHIFDQESIESGRELEYPVHLVKRLGYKILIDDQQNTVYMFAYTH